MVTTQVNETQAKKDALIDVMHTRIDPQNPRCTVQLEKNCHGSQHTTMTTTTTTNNNNNNTDNLEIIIHLTCMPHVC